MEAGGDQNLTWALLSRLHFLRLFLGPHMRPSGRHGGVGVATNRPWPLTPINIDMYVQENGKKQKQTMEKKNK